MAYQFPVCPPEEVGIPSKAISDFLDYTKRNGIEMHSLMILRHGKVCTAGWWSPYGPDIMHPVFSFGKSITSTAIGFAEQEGILSIDEKIVDIFADYLPDEPSEYLKKVTLRHVLSMSIGHSVEPNAHSEDWIREFLAHPIDHEPGTMFQYNNTGTNMLVATLKIKTGLGLTEFLKPRLFDPLGIKDVACRERNGYELGAFGFQLTTDGMARFAQFVLNRGVWNGKRLLNEAWFDMATSKQVETVGGVYDGKRDWAAGYGFQYWQFERDDKAFRADGACGQFAMFFPKQGAVIVTTAGTSFTQQMIDGVWETIVPSMAEEPLPENEEEYRALRDKVENLRIPPLPAYRAPEIEKEVGSNSYKPDQEIRGMTGLLAGFGLNMEQKGNLEYISFRFNEKTMDLVFGQEGSETVLPIGLQSRFVTNTVDGREYAAVGRWRGPRAFEAEIRDLGNVSGSRLIFRFEDDKLNLTVDPTMFMSMGPRGAKSPVFTFTAVKDQ